MTLAPALPENAPAAPASVEGSASTALASAPSLEETLARYGPALSRLASGYARNRAEREDLMQDIAVALLVALPTFRGACPERAFVLRVAHNRALALVTRRRIEKLEPLDDDIESKLASDQTAAPDVVEQHRRRTMLIDAIRRLPVTHRQVVMLSLEGLSHDEIADAVGGNANAVGVRLHRARAELAKLLETYTSTEKGGTR